MRTRLAGGLVLMCLTLGVLAQEDEEQGGKKEKWDVTLARGETRQIEFTTEEGTFMSLDVSPDGQWIVFDLLAHIYRVPASGGEAECLTQDSGVAVNYHPRFSPDGKHIAFVSDRKGQSNLWIMDADGSNPRAVFTSLKARVVEPAWLPGGDYIVVRRQAINPPGQQGGSGIYMVHKAGGEGIELIGRDQSGAAWPSPSPDGKHIYFQARAGQQRDFLKGALQIRRYDLKSGLVMDVTEGTAGQQSRGSSGGAAAPQVSPDGRWLAFARRQPAGTISYKGHRFGPRTALWLRDLHSGAERMVMDPIEQDMAEGMKTLRVLPGYVWAPDGKSIFLSQGGKIRRLQVESGRVETIPFRARVQRTISEMAHKPFRITDAPFQARFLRWHTASPDGSKLVFQAVGKLWIQDLPGGSPQRLTPESFQHSEFSPSWSPDGKWVAFSSWHDTQSGHLWKIAASGGQPQRLSQQQGEYIHPVWTQDGSRIVAARGSGATLRGRNMADNPWYELVSIPASGGQAQVVIRVDRTGNGRNQIVRASMGPLGRIFFPRPQKPEEGQTRRRRPPSELVSVLADGSDLQIHLTFPYADEAAISPDGKWVAFQEGDNVYLTPLPPQGSGGEPVHITKKKAKLPVRQLSKEGGLFPRWRDANTVEFGSAHRYFAYDVQSEETQTTEITLMVPRDIPQGRIALTDARIITLKDRQVIGKGTLVIEGSRIQCVGECSIEGADQVIDASGKTIVPGFIDMHAHHYREYQGILPEKGYEMAIYLAYGVTANLDNSMWSQNVFASAELIDAGRSIGPRTFSTGDPLYRGDGPRQNELSSYEVTEQNIRRLKSWGAVSVKQYLQPRRDQRQWVSDIARKEGLMVTAEGSDLAYNLSMIMDGQTAWEHPMSYMPVYSDAAKFFGQAKAVYSPTFIVGGPGAWNEEHYFQQGELWKDEKMRRFLPWRQLIPHTRRYTHRPETDYSFPLVAQGMADIIAQGGYGAIGSHGQHHGIGSHWEIWMAAEAMGPMGALEVASVHGAHFLGASQDLGSIEAGKLADLVVLNSNPLEDIRNTSDIRYVIKGGILYDGDTLDELWPRQRPFGEYYWVNQDIYREDDRPVGYWDKEREN
ncbi:MAG: amidohydrolase family protein [Acidobacteriota bacterium]